MSVQRRNIFGPNVAQQETGYTGTEGPGGSVDGTGPAQYPTASNDPMGDTGVDDNTSARHAGIVQDHISARDSLRGQDYAGAGNETGAGMVLGTPSPLTTSPGGGDDPNQGNPSKGIAGSDSFSVSGDGDSGDQTGAGKVLG